jgi:hypothetical protein
MSEKGIRMVTVREAEREAHKSIRDRALDLEYQQVMGMTMGATVLFPTLLLAGSLCLGWYPLEAPWTSAAALFLWLALDVLIMHITKLYYDAYLDDRTQEQIRWEQEWRAIHAPQAREAHHDQSVS